MLWTLIKQVRQFLLAEYAPDGFNNGINDGIAAGQTVMHLHIHLIPRYGGDTEDPRGGAYAGLFLKKHRTGIDDATLISATGWSAGGDVVVFWSSRHGIRGRYAGLPNCV